MMAEQVIQRIGDLQLKILQSLWERGEGSVAEVQADLAGDHAYTTIATMLRKMEDRKLVQHRAEGRRFIYLPAVTAEQVTRGMSDRLVDHFFGGSLATTVSHLLQHRDVDPAELDALQELIDQHRRGDSDKSGGAS